VANTFFRKNINRLITYSSGGNKTQNDYLLVRRIQLKNAKNVNEISSEECISQHKLLIGVVTLSTKPSTLIRIPPRRKTWKLNDEDIHLNRVLSKSARMFLWVSIMLGSTLSLLFLKLLKHVVGRKDVSGMSAAQRNLVAERRC